MLPAFKEHIHNNFSFLKGKKLLVAVSGGIDSIVLTHLLYNLQFHISLAHCNFRLRGKDSDMDEVFVKTEASKMNIPCFVTRFNTKHYATSKGISIQMAARELRYNWFDEIVQKNNIDYILTAHHADDDLETFLINLTRGTGLDGLTGIPAINKNIIRPLLPFTRKEIESFAKSNTLSWREDKSNIETKYLRNKIRHDIIPVLKSLNPNFMESFSKTLENLQGSKQLVEERIDEIQSHLIHKSNSFLKLNIQKLKSLNNPKASLFELLNSYGFTEWDDVLSLLKAQPGKQVFSKTHRLLKDREFLLLTELHPTYNNKKEYKISDKDQSIKLVDLKLKFTHQKTKNLTQQQADSQSTNNNLIYLDKDKLIFPLTVRKWKNGDYFYPIGMQGKKKLSKYFKDEKFSLLDKEKIWLLCSNNNIVWVIGKRLDNRFKINKNTTEILKIEIIT